MFAPSDPRYAGAPSGTGQCVLGIDPGLTRCGYAVLIPGTSGSAQVRALGVLRTDRDDDTPKRLADLAVDIEALLDEFAPTAVAVERVFFQNNVRTAIGVAQASGVVLAAAARRGCIVAEYTPSQVKDTVAGWGAADKGQVQRMVQMRLGLADVPKPPDAADAAAIALCHLAMSPGLLAAASGSAGRR
ncbi:MAG: crossover junction endodeoxyribonuclease RuvC [Acidobacteria bacterium]|nr:crossover junction endodeoxyribonuclease RuvC [Acidobacteriota bacterium]